jgi:hypothetical protein
MSALPLKTAISGVYPNPDNATANAGFGALWDALNEATEKPELDLASAATIDLGGQLSTKLRITGTTGPITSFGTTYRGPIFGRFQSALAITHNATTLILPGGANLTTSAGGTFIAVPKATTSGTHDGWIVIYASDYFAKAGANGTITSLTGLTDAPMFGAFLNGAQTTSASNQIIQNSFEDFDTHGAYDNTTYTFTAPVAGKYHFDVGVTFGTISTSGVAIIELLLNGSPLRRAKKNIVAGESDHLSISCIFDMAAGETVAVRSTGSTAVAALDTLNRSTHFSGCRVR